jgi:hypothetical protein
VLVHVQVHVQAEVHVQDGGLMCMATETNQSIKRLTFRAFKIRTAAGSNNPW